MILERWTELKEKLISTINHLKANSKDNWALVKSKSVPNKVPSNEARTTYNLSQNQIVIAENKLDKVERKLERIRDLIANNEIAKLKSLIAQGKI